MHCLSAPLSLSHGDDEGLSEGGIVTDEGRSGSTAISLGVNLGLKAW